MRLILSKEINNKLSSQFNKSINGDFDCKELSSPKKAFATILSESWDYLFSEHDNTVRDKCVYIHHVPEQLRSNNINYKYPNNIIFEIPRPFYIGKGDKKRVNNFNSRSRFHQKRLNKLLKQGYKKEELVLILKDGLTDREARELESKLILFFGCNTGDKYKCLYSGSGILMNLTYEPFPEKYKKFTQLK